MSKFIEVTVIKTFNGNGIKTISIEGEKMLIDLDFIYLVYDREISLKDGSSLYVKESYEELKANLTGCMVLKANLTGCMVLKPNSFG